MGTWSAAWFAYAVKYAGVFLPARDTEYLAPECGGSLVILGVSPVERLNAAFYLSPTFIKECG
jgi:hypothetical protein